MATEPIAKEWHKLVIKLRGLGIQDDLNISYQLNNKLYPIAEFLNISVCQAFDDNYFVEDGEIKPLHEKSEEPTVEDVRKELFKRLGITEYTFGVDQGSSEGDYTAFVMHRQEQQYAFFRAQDSYGRSHTSIDVTYVEKPTIKARLLRFFDVSRFFPLVDLSGNATITAHKIANKSVTFEWQGGSRIEITQEFFDCSDIEIEGESFRIGEFKLFIISREPRFDRDCIIAMRDGFRARAIRCLHDAWIQFLGDISRWERRALGEEWSRKNEGKAKPITAWIHRMVKV